MLKSRSYTRSLRKLIPVSEAGSRVKSLESEDGTPLPGWLQDTAIAQAGKRKRAKFLNIRTLFQLLRGKSREPGFAFQPIDVFHGAEAKFYGNGADFGKFMFDPAKKWQAFDRPAG